MVNASQRSCACDWLCWYVATGTRRGKRVLRLDDQQLVLSSENPMRRRLDKLVRRRFEDQSMVCFVIDFSVRIYFQPFVPYLSNPRALFSRELFRRFPVVSVVVLARARLLPESSGFLAGLVVAQYKGERQYRTLMGCLMHPLPCGSSFPLFFGVSCIAYAFYSLLFISVVLLLSVLGFDPMSLQGLVCFFVALFSENPGSTAGRGFNPAGGAPGGG
ncbi:hypothetical protein F511_42850 [Dorcoceras hygrometricum]|uniref:Uncharacterized protein n=1 Tax=Dorcoceras hygrometricum TaxID=472368 RepID=A0A2Z7D239_9LAMI|nr:hypothetical protein F511_42850 [Dorcoceras hygrometricum]